MKHKRLVVIAALIVVAIAVPVLVFFTRPPVLVVTDVPFAALYGVDRLRQRQFEASISMFRRVKPVMVADGASPDMLVFAVSEAAPRPFCVLFPRSQAQAAGRYHEQFPEVPAAVLNGIAPASGLPAPEGTLCVYSTDREADLYRAGLFAGIIGTAEPVNPAESPTGGDENAAQDAPVPRTYVLWQDRSVRAEEREMFSNGVKEQDPEAVISITGNAAGMAGAGGISCIVLTSARSEYFENPPKIPLILFSWMDPAFATSEVAVLFDDSPWALAVEAAQMAVSGQAEGKIPSKALILPGKTADNRIFRLLQKSAKKVSGQASDNIDKK